ncbi:hypothetical protein N4T77_16660 [Clostridium sp. CX1]|uniref:Uncharacterized protein n=1 Tax=Clostridium tanneri TaxID=3037988 RepID=A0ABU4JP43_9CLOT|nr:MULTISPECIES: hypothetical protein [unclassified Clostridium]MCT8978221.1 hypothetical protein [Clostridium sp. CX1]MDW8799887.1 hypothetical protein [Clostridium sp. A1-XYC3]
MAKKYSVILMQDENSCAVKQISQNTFDQIHDMKKSGENDAKIVKSLTEINTTEDNIVINGVSRSEAIDYALDDGADYVIIKAFDT